MVHEDVLGGGTVAQAASPVAAGTAATIVRPKAVIVAVKALIFGLVFIQTLVSWPSGTLKMISSGVRTVYLWCRFASVVSAALEKGMDAVHRTCKERMTGLTEAQRQQQRTALERMMPCQIMKEERRIVKALQIKISTGYLYKG